MSLARHSQTAFAIVALAAAPAAARAVASWQTPESIRQAAERYVTSRLDGNFEGSVEPAGIDSRLRLPGCAGRLGTRAHGSASADRTTVAVSCDSPQRWQVFVPVRIFRTVGVVVARRPISAGEIIDTDAVRLIRRSSAGLPSLYASSLAAVVGQRARLTISEGSIVRSTAVDVMKAVQRGTIVTLETRKSGISVRGEGEAIEAGGIGDRIRIRTPAGRVVEGTVLSGTEVRVGR